MTVLITGAAGFVGHQLVRRLVDEGRSVVGLGRHEKPPGLSCDWLRYDLGGAVRPRLPPGVETIVHLAASHPGPHVTEAEFERSNVQGMRHVIAAAKAEGVAHVVVGSSGAVYGEGQAPFQESDPLRPRDAYGRSKAAAEALVTGPDVGFAVTIVRIFFPYGPDQQPGRLVPRLVDAVKEGRPIPLNREGRPRLNPVHVTDVVTALRTVVDRRAAGTFNLAGPEATSVGDLARRIGAFAGREPIFEDTGKEAMDILGDSGRLARFTGERSRIMLNEGIASLRSVAAARSGAPF